MPKYSVEYSLIFNSGKGNLSVLHKKKGVCYARIQDKGIGEYALILYLDNKQNNYGGYFKKNYARRVVKELKKLKIDISYESISRTKSRVRIKTSNYKEIVFSYLLMRLSHEAPHTILMKDFLTFEKKCIKENLPINFFAMLRIIFNKNTNKYGYSHSIFLNSKEILVEEDYKKIIQGSSTEAHFNIANMLSLKSYKQEVINRKFITTDYSIPIIDSYKNYLNEK